MKMDNYKFTLDFWNDDHYYNFRMLADRLNNVGKPRILEIGVFEGKTTTWLLEHVSQSHITMIEPDPGPNFWYNLKPWIEDGKKSIHPRLEWKKCYSFNYLSGLLPDEKFDMIYIDGDHNACGVLEDAVMAWRHLKKGGMLLFDDYLMKVKDPWFYISHKEFNDKLVWQHPKNAIDAFMNIYKGQYSVFIDNYQIALFKTNEIGEKNINHGNENLKTNLNI